MLRYLKLISEICIALVLVTLVVWAVWTLMADQGATNTSKTKIVFKGYVASAEVFRGRYFDYNGLCADIGLPPSVQCSDSESTYRFWMRLSDGALYCADHQGFNGTVGSIDPQESACN